ncbi:MAG TPA: response regulator transcription factor, partial [Flavisolibacter sp.]|nr:response regulator transcription factor [Flavisolibacter sp.]
MIQNSKPIKLVLADDHEIFRDGFRSMIRKQPIVELVGEAADGEELVDICLKLKPDIIITDIKMPKMDGIEATKRLARELPETGIIALSMFDEENLIVDMMEAGARGYLLKNAHKTEILEAITSVFGGQTYYCTETSARLAQMIAKSRFVPAARTKKIEFNDREIAVIRYICQQMSN